MEKQPALPEWLKRARAERLLTEENVAEVFDVSVDDVKAWEAGTRRVPDRLLFSVTRWLETGYLPDRVHKPPPRDAYPWRVDPRA